MGDIGKTLRKIDLEPMPDDIPAPEIVPESEPAQPASTPEREHEPVPAGLYRSGLGGPADLESCSTLPNGRRVIRPESEADWLEQAMTQWMLYGDVYYERPLDDRVWRLTSG